MADERITLPFQEAIDFQEGPGILAKDFRDTGVPLVRLAGLDRDVSVLAGCNYLNPEMVQKRWSHFALKEGDILLSTSASLGRITVVTSEGNGAIAYTGIIRMRPRNESVFGPFIRYLLEGPDFQHQAEMAGVGSVIRHFGPMHLKRMTVVLPPVEEQRAIVHILGTLDDKLDLNRRMNQTLELIAASIFKSWFVDFDPVRAKVEGRKPLGMKAETAALFSDQLVNSELGQIPDGWAVGTFGELISRRKERVCNREAIVLSAVASGELVVSDDYFTKRVYSKEISKYLLVQHWDLAYNPSRINIGSIGMLKSPIAGAVSPVYIVARPKTDYRWFIEFSLHRTYTKEWINNLASGSVRQSLSFPDFASIPCVIPPENVLKQFNGMWELLRLAMQANSEQNQTLTTMRDALLPMLISGEICVRDAERFVEEHAC